MTKELNKNMTMLASVMKCFSIVMALVYIGAGIAIIWQSQNLFDMQPRFGIPLGLSLVAYGGFRSYRVYQKYFHRS